MRNLLFAGLLYCLLLSTAAYAQNIGIGTATPNSKLDIAGDIALRSATINITAVGNYALDVNTLKQSGYKLVQTGFPPAGNFFIAGITAGADGRQVTLYNRTGSSLELYNDNPVAAASNRIITGTGTSLAVYNGGSALLRYDTSVNKWEVISSHNNSLDFFGSPAAWLLAGNAGTNASSFIGTTDSQPLRFKVNGQTAGLINPVNDITAIGYYSLNAVSSGTANSAFGNYAMQSTTTGSNNTAIGTSSLFANTSGFKNTAAGAGAMAGNTTGFSNTAAGFGSLQQNSTGFENTAVGISALENNTGGSNNTAAGSYALQSNTTGYNNTATGNYALSVNTTGYENVAVGNLALSSNSNGLWNTAIGSNALLGNTTANSNTAVGFEALKVNTKGFKNCAFGYRSLANNDNNIAVHGNSGNGNAAFGSQSMEANTTGWYNAALGEGALKLNTSGTANSAVGNYALSNNISGNDNAAFGMFALSINTTGNRNTAIGSAAGYGSGNTGDNNTYIGYGTFSHTSASGSYNTAVGAQAFDNLNLTAVDYSTALGNISGPTIAGFINSISIGHDSHANGTDRAEIGSTFMQVIGGYKPWSTLVSDGRFKRNVQHDVKGLDFIMQLQPVTYTVDYHALEKFKGIPSFEESIRRDDSIHTVTTEEIVSVRKMQAAKEASLKTAEATIQNGFIAQDVLIAAEKSGYRFDGVNIPQHEKDNYSIAYSQFVVPLVKAVQEQQALIEKLQQQNERLQKRVETLEKNNALNNLL